MTTLPVVIFIWRLQPVGSFIKNNYCFLIIFLATRARKFFHKNNKTRFFYLRSLSSVLVSPESNVSDYASGK